MKNTNIKLNGLNVDTDNNDALRLTSKCGQTEVTVKQVDAEYIAISVRTPDGKYITINAHSRKNDVSYASSNITMHHQVGVSFNKRAKITKKQNSCKLSDGDCVWTEVLADGEEIISIFN